MYSSPEGLYKAEHFLVRMKMSEGIKLSEILNKHQALFECLFNFFHEFWTLRWVAVGPFYSLCFLSMILNFSYSSILQSKTMASCCMKFRLRLIVTLESPHHNYRKTEQIVNMN